MKIKSSDLVSIFEETLKGGPQKSLQEVGIVLQVGDNVCRVHGLRDAIYQEVVEFEGGNKGIIFDLDEDFVSIFLLYNDPPVKEQEIAKRTYKTFKTPVGTELLGRVINAVGQPLDSLGELRTKEVQPIESTIPGVIERSPIDEPMQTGVLVVDALVPIGKGQRELIIGNRNTGKTALAIDTILNQRNKNVFCVYVSIGQRQASLARIVQQLEVNDALKYTVVIGADAGDPVLNQYLAPYVGCTIAEYFRNIGKDALIVYDNLTNHAVAYREMSLLMRRPPGREAFPGDVFYLHSRLLERAGKLKSGGSLTALPIAQVQRDDITAYIPTNLISITDGQIFLDTKLFNEGIRPAVNVELSVSRVGGAAQTKAIRRVTRALGLELAQYQDLLAFAQFGAELDEISQERLKRGSIIVQLLKQPQYQHYSFVDEALILYLFKKHFLDDVSLKEVSNFASKYAHYVQSVYPNIYEEIERDKDMSDDLREKLVNIAKEFKKVFS
ncbi:F0F1 ATP synthase subunit alpha [candidate division TM6 bacterium RIFCSPHIGHO2_12_FULL_32_22]|nr:MAG: F0F1 ATP synthase subunit alpha [candidate division TM6 bacterium RIFCSPHIGHO2_12_FULL_32_22]